MKNFLDQNKVFLFGLLASIAVVLQQFVGQPEISFKAIGFAILMAVLSYLAKEWRGQALSIFGIVGNLAGVFVTAYDGGNFTWEQFILQGTIALIAVAVPAPKSRGYENTDGIKMAKREGEEIQPAKLTKV